MSALAEERERWRAVRRFLDTHRHPLAVLAAQLYPDRLHVAGTPLLAPPGWVPAHPVALAADAGPPHWRPDTPASTLTGAEPETEPARSADGHGRPYPTYAAALQALAPPRLFENRCAYRLAGTGVDRPPDPSRLIFGRGRYFDIVNVCEAAAHEFADAVLGRPGPPADLIRPRGWPGAGQPSGLLGGRFDEGLLPGWAELAWRRRVADPFDAGCRPMIPAVSTLVVRLDRTSGRARFLLHRRDATKVASGGGLVQVVPVGIFQPSADASWNEVNDLDIWRATVRELAEELLGRDEDHGSDRAPIDYGGWPLYRSLADARTTGRLGVYWLGVGVDPLTLAVDMLLAAVFDADVFDSLFAGLVTANDEGEVVGGSSTAGIPFDADEVERYAGGEPMQPAGAALLRLAWQHRATLLG